MKPIETSTLDGGWCVHPSGPATLRTPWRNHEIDPTLQAPGSEDVFTLPVAFPQAAGTFANTAGMQIPLGTIIYVHNLSTAGGTAQIETVGAVQVWTLPPDESTAFVLVAADGANVGTWRRIGIGWPNIVGPAPATGISTFTLDLTVSQNDVNVLAEAVDAGYDGVLPARVKVTVHEHVVIGGTVGNYSLDMGGDAAIGGINWAAGSTFLLINRANILGHGGAGGGGGIGGTGAAAGQPGGNGGKALRAPNDLLIVNEGVIQAGGGGGGGGNTSVVAPGVNAGAGGGGAGATVSANGAVDGGPPGTSGTAALTAGYGTLWSGGNAGEGSVVASNRGGTGGQGGQGGSNGGTGAGYNNVGAGASGGLAGYAISRSAGATVTFAPGAAGIVTGGTIVE